MSYFDEREPKTAAKKPIQQGPKDMSNIAPDTRKGVAKTIKKAMEKANVKFSRNAEELEALIYARAHNKDNYMFMVATLVVQLYDEPARFRRIVVPVVE